MTKKKKRLANALKLDPNYDKNNYKELNPNILRF
jgi:hypothetical protein